jgi:hypothetical protein
MTRKPKTRRARANVGEQTSDDAKAEFRARAEALVAEYGAPLPDGDAGLIEAERRLHELDPSTRRPRINCGSAALAGGAVMSAEIGRGPLARASSSREAINARVELSGLSAACRELRSARQIGAPLP